MGARRLQAAYALALAAQYRFLSYGDAMWLPRRLESDWVEGEALPTLAGSLA